MDAVTLVPPVAPGGRIPALLARHPLVSFFVLAFAGSWLFGLPLLLSADGAGLLSYSSPLLKWTAPLSIFVGPFLAAFIVTGATEGREGAVRLLRRVVLWRVGVRWYLFALLGMPALVLLSLIVMPGVLGSFLGLDVLAPLPLLGVFSTSWSLAARWAKSRAGAGSPCPDFRCGTVRWSGV